jgi:hypothetical protein
MVRLQWVRPILAALAFVWVMLAWHAHQRSLNREREYLIGLIERVCASGSPAQDQRDDCEIVFRSRLFGGITGNVDVSGTVDVGR